MLENSAEKEDNKFQHAKPLNVRIKSANKEEIRKIMKEVKRSSINCGLCKLVGGSG